jgi:hypothetical protein
MISARSSSKLAVVVQIDAIPAVLVLLLFLTCGTSRADPPQRFTQDRFAIGFWSDPPVDTSADARYAEIAEAHFTMVIANFGARTEQDVRRVLALCEKHDLKAIVARCGLPPEKLPDSPACWGYVLADEPGSGAFPDLRNEVDAIRGARPGKLAYINLYPTYAPLAALGTRSYEEYLAQFAKLVQPDVISMDHYPQFRPDADGREAYCGNLAAMRDVALANNRPHWNFFNAMPFGDHADPTEAQLRWQVYTSLAYGSRGVMYFCYHTPQGSEFPKGGAILARDGRRTRHYDEAKRINAVIKKLGPVLMKLKSTGVYRLGPKNDSAAVLKNTPLRDITGDALSRDLLVGTFEHTDGRRAVMLNNYAFAYAAWPTVVFAADLSQIKEVNPSTGEEVPVRDDSPDLPGLQLSLDAGQGRLFLISR